MKPLVLRHHSNVCSLLLLAAPSGDAASHLLVVAIGPGLSPQMGSAAPWGRSQPVTAFQKEHDVQNQNKQIAQG